MKFQQNPLHSPPVFSCNVFSACLRRVSDFSNSAILWRSSFMSCSLTLALSFTVFPLKTGNSSLHPIPSHRFNTLASCIILQTTLTILIRRSRCTRHVREYVKASRKVVALLLMAMEMKVSGIAQNVLISLNSIASTKSGSFYQFQIHFHVGEKYRHHPN